jgi:hypothetical protein
MNGTKRKFAAEVFSATCEVADRESAEVWANDDCAQRLLNEKIDAAKQSKRRCCIADDKRDFKMLLLSQQYTFFMEYFKRQMDIEERFFIGGGAFLTLFHDFFFDNLRKTANFKALPHQ